MKWIIKEDGSIGVKHQNLTLDGGFPKMNGKGIRTLSVHVTEKNYGGTITYSTLEGNIITDLLVVGDKLALETRLEGFEHAPHWIHPIGDLSVTGGDRFFKQGFGFAGPSGIYPLDKELDGKCLESYLATGIISDSNETIVFGCFDNTRFLHRATLRGYAKRSGLNDQHFGEMNYLLESGFSTEGILCEGSLQLPTLYFMAGCDPLQIFVDFARELANANGVSKCKDSRYHFCSWYHRGPYYNIHDLNEMLTGLERIDPKPELQAIQIDDGYYPAVGDWLLPSYKFPNTLKEAFRLINEKGYQPGVWVAPFMVGSNSEVAKNHPDWLLKDIEGNKIVEFHCIEQGYQNESHNDDFTYVLDSSHPEAFAYLRTVFSTMRKWGAAVYKTDFMDWGYRDSLTVQRYTPGKTSAEYFMDVIKMIRNEIGEESYWLACISPFAPLVGYADGMRIGNDMACTWTLNEAAHLMRESAASQYMNGVLWQNDPDVTYIRDILIKHTKEQREAVAIWNSIIGGCVSTSDPFHRINQDALKLWRFIKPSKEVTAALIIDWDKAGLKNTAVRHYPKQNAWSVFTINIFDEEKTIIRKIESLTGESKLHVYEWGIDHIEYLGEKEELVFDMKPTSGKLYYLTKDNRPPASAMTLGGIDK